MKGADTSHHVDRLHLPIVAIAASATNHITRSILPGLYNVQKYFLDTLIYISYLLDIWCASYILLSKSECMNECSWPAVCLERYWSFLRSQAVLDV